jgi:hypothetical protein
MTKTIPVTITPEAEARVAELGMRAELEQMLERARLTIPGLARLQVGVEQPYDTGGEPSIGIEARTDQVWAPEDRTWKDYSRWKINTFPARVWSHFTLLLTPEENRRAAAIASLPPP